MYTNASGPEICDETVSDSMFIGLSFSESMLLVNMLVAKLV